MKHTTIRITDEAHQGFFLLAKEKKRSVNWVINEIGENLNKPVKPKKNRKPLTKELLRKTAEAMRVKDSVDFMGLSHDFKVAWSEWTTHKKEIGNSYKSDRTESIAIASLAKRLGGSEKRMIEAIYFSIGNNYKGIYEQDRNSKANKPSLTEQFVREKVGGVGSSRFEGM